MMMMRVISSSLPGGVREPDARQVLRHPRAPVGGLCLCVRARRPDGRGQDDLLLAQNREIHLNRRIRCICDSTTQREFGADAEEEKRHFVSY